MTDYRPDTWSSVGDRNVDFSLRHDIQIDFATIRFWCWGVFPDDESWPLASISWFGQEYPIQDELNHVRLYTLFSLCTWSCYIYITSIEVLVEVQTLKYRIGKEFLRDCGITSALQESSSDNTCCGTNFFSGVEASSPMFCRVECWRACAKGLHSHPTIKVPEI